MAGSISAASAAGNKHIPQLDGVRAIAVLIVIAFHYWQTFATGPLDTIGKLATWGQTGVDLFFVLSGFLINGILLDSRNSQHFLRNFYVRRMLRIFPLYYLTLLLFYVAGPVLDLTPWATWKQSLWFYTYLQNIPMTFTPLDVHGPGHFWSLAVEEHYYLLWPLLVMLLGRRQLLAASITVVALSVVTRAALLHLETSYFTFAHLDGLALGSALAILARGRPEGLARYVRWARYVLFGIAPLMAALQITFSGTAMPLIIVLKTTLISLVYAALLVLVVENRCGKLAGKVLTGRILKSVGKYSYGMYVFHPFILMGLLGLGFPYNLPGLLIAILLTYITAWVSWTLFEARFLSLKRFFEYQAPAAPKTEPAATYAGR